LQGGGDANLGEVNIQLASAEERRFDSNEVARRWRELTGPVPDAIELLYTASLFNPGPPIAIQFASSHMEDLREASTRLKAALEGYPGVYGVSDSFRPGKQEMRIAIRPEGESLGLTLADLAALTEGDPKRTVLELSGDVERTRALSDDGRARLARVLEVLVPAVRDRARLPLRRWVESCWLALGGPATLRSASELSSP
jgi:multidrug efflux pump subunit AcrB